MTETPEKALVSAAQSSFAQAAAAQSDIFPKRRAPPFSLRLSSAERQRLTDEAAGVPLGTYIKGKLLDQRLAPIRRRRSGLAVEDRQALARALGLLGQSRISSNLNQLAHAANLGALPLTPEVEADLAETLAAVREMRSLLLQSLGIKGGKAR